MNETKHWYESKTILVNIGFALLVAIQAITGALQPLLPVDLYATIAALLPAVNAFLRTISDTGIKPLDDFPPTRPINYPMD